MSVTFSLSDSINADDDGHGISMSALQVRAGLGPNVSDLEKLKAWQDHQPPDQYLYCHDSQAMLVGVLRTQLNTTTYQPTESCQDVCVEPIPHQVERYRLYSPLFVHLC